MATKEISAMRNVFVNTFKFTTNTAMVMLFAVSFIFCACSGESIGDYHPSSASNLLGSMTESNGLGWAQVDVEASATDINGNPLNANADVRYTCEKEVFVENEEELGLPVVLSLAGDNLIATGDGNVITRTENHSASKGVVLNITGPDLSKGGYLGERTESGNTIRQEVLVNPSDEAFATAPLPESFQKEWRDSKVSTVRYYRVYTKVQAQYRQRAERINGGKGKVYYDLFLEKSTDGGRTWESVKKYEAFLACMYGQWKPNVVNTLAVSSFDFVTKDEVVEMEKDQPVSADGWQRENVISKEYRWGDEFNAPADAVGSTTRLIGGAQILKVWKAICTNPETGEEVVFDFNGEITSTHEVNKTTGIYTRTVSINLNGEVIETQPGSVQLQIAN